MSRRIDACSMERKPIEPRVSESRKVNSKLTFIIELKTYPNIVIIEFL